MYAGPESNAQIRTLIKGGPQAYYRLCLLFAKFTKKDRYYDFLHGLLRRGLKDTEYLSRVMPYMVHYTPSPAKMAAKYFNRLKEHAPTVRNYLDYGCGKCDVAPFIGQLYGLTKEHIYGTDLRGEFETDWAATRAGTDIQFDYCDDGIPFTAQFDLITCFMVLHHIEDAAATVRQLHDRLAPGGVLYVREHNCCGDRDRMFADLTHSFFIVQSAGGDGARTTTLSPEAEQRILAQRMWYKSAAEWAALFAEIGFDELQRQDDVFSVSNNYSVILRKRANAATKK